MNPKIIELALELWNALVRDTRSDSSEGYRLKENAPAWMSDVIRESHDDWPDDTIYEWINRAACAFGEASEDSDSYEVVSWIEPDIYTSDLTEWLNRRNDHVYYLTEVLEEFGGGLKDGLQLLGLAQKSQIDEVANALYAALKKQTDEIEEE